MQEALEQGIALVTSYGLKLIGAILILIVGRMAASWVAKAVDRWLQKSGKVDDTLRPFFASFARYLVLIRHSSGCPFTIWD